MIEVATVDAASTIRLLEAIEALYPMLALIHVFLDNARYHHAKLVQDWLSRPDCRIRLHFVPAYCPHLNPIGTVMERHAQACHAQQMLRHIYPICRRDAQFSARRAGDEPGFVVVPGELNERGSQLIDLSIVSKVLAHNRFSFKVRMKRSATPLPWGSRTKEGEASIPKHSISSWNARGHVVGAMIVTQHQSTRHTRCDRSEAPMHPLAHRLQRLEAIGRTRGMNADDFRIGVFHGDEDIGPAFLDGDRLRHVCSPHFIDLVGDDRSACLGKAAEAGLPAALYLLGVMSERGLGVTRDEGAAAEFYRRAAEKGHRSGQARWGRR